MMSSRSAAVAGREGGSLKSGALVRSSWTATLRDPEPLRLQLRQIEHILRDRGLGDILKVLRRLAQLVGIAQQRSHQSFVTRSIAMTLLAAGQDDTSERDVVHGADQVAPGRGQGKLDPAGPDWPPSRSCITNATLRNF